MDINENMGNNQNGINGINVSDVINKCSRIRDNYDELTNDFIKKIEELFFELSNVWGSEKAVIFGQRMEVNINQALKNIKNEYQNMLDRTTATTRKWINQLGLNAGISNYSLSNKLCTSISMKDNINGITGMKLKLVDDLLTSRLGIIISSADRILSSLPSSISLYDESNSQKIAFLQNTRKIRSVVDEIIRTIADEIKKIIKEEQQIIEQAKKESIDILNENIK